MFSFLQAIYSKVFYGHLAAAASCLQMSFLNTTRRRERQKIKTGFYRATPVNQICSSLESSMALILTRCSSASKANQKGHFYCIPSGGGRILRKYATLRWFVAPGISLLIQLIMHVYGMYILYTHWSMEPRRFSRYCSLFSIKLQKSLEKLVPPLAMTLRP